MNVEELLHLMIKKGISDIHFKVGSSPLIRIDGRLLATGLEKFTPKNIEDIANSIMKPDQKKYFEAEAEMDFAYSIDEVSRFRVNVYKQKGTIALTLRVIPLKIKSFEELNLPKDTLEKLAAESRGLLLIAGVTGAGKTTTMNTMLDTINENNQYNIITVEDPIEFYHYDKKSSISQREVGTDTASYAKALKHSLRQDPDLIVIGEMRDYEAMSAAITAAETGHLVLSTIHTLDSVQTIDRIVDTYPPHQQNSVRSQIGNVLKGIVAQRLVMKKNGEGRIPVTEILIQTSLTRKLISEGKFGDLYKLMEQGAYYGMHTFDQDLLRVYQEGQISMKEALDKATNPDDLALKLRGIEKSDN